MSVGKILLTLSLAFVFGSGAAEVIHIPVGQQGGDLQDIARPTRGMSKAEVLERFGLPLKQNAAVGEPPIAAWRYPHYTVYFESDTVIHSVLIHRPKLDVGSAQDE